MLRAGSTSPELYYLKVSKLKDRAGNDVTGGEERYIRLEGEIGKEAKVGKKAYSTINKNDIKFLSKNDIQNASLFTEADLNDVVQAFKKNPEYRTFGVNFKKELAPSNVSKIDFAKKVFDEYAKKAFGSDE